MYSPFVYFFVGRRHLEKHLTCVLYSSFGNWTYLLRLFCNMITFSVSIWKSSYSLVIIALTKKPTLFWIFCYKKNKENMLFNACYIPPPLHSLLKILHYKILKMRKIAYIKTLIIICFNSTKIYWKYFLRNQQG